MLTRNQIIIIGIVGAIVLFFVLIILGVIPGLKSTPQGGGGGGGGPQAQLNFWGMEDENIFRSIFDSYQSSRGVKINYTKFSESAYEKNLIDALASGRGPDILAFHNTWLSKHIGKISPVPASANFSAIQARNLFPQAVESDFVKDGKVYALPIYIDTLAFIYNRDFFDSRGIATTPGTWQEFQYALPALKEIDSSGRIAKAAAAIGGSGKSIDKFDDLLSLLMFQFGSKINSRDSNSVDFSGNKEAAQALNFYLQFGISGNQYYTWSDNLNYSLDGFSRGDVGAIFNYSSAIPLIKAKNHFLNFQVAPMLQFSQNIANYADYWGLAVSSQSKQQVAAWNFILHLSANPAAAEQYLQASKKPPALRTLIQKYMNDPDLGVFNQQTLTAKSWKQKDKEAIKKIFSDMIESILSGRLSSDKALQQAESEINSL